MDRDLLTQSTLLKINLSHIDLNPGPFCMSFNVNFKPLKTSIKEFGVLNPPYLLKNPDGKLLVVAGYRRLLAVKELGFSIVLCKVFSDDFPRFKALLLNINDNLAHRQLNDIEKAMVLQRLTNYVSKEDLLNNFMPILGLPQNNRILKLFLDINKLENVIKVSIATGIISLKVAGLMGTIGRKVDRLKLNDLFVSLKWSVNQQWELMQYVLEIASREGRSIKNILDDKEIREVLDNNKINKPQRVKAILKILKCKRFPSILRSETIFKKAIAGLSLPSGVKITPPPFFEDINYRLEIVFKEGKELKDKLSSLYQLPGLEKVTDF